MSAGKTLLGMVGLLMVIGVENDLVGVGGWVVVLVTGKDLNDSSILKDTFLFLVESCVS